MAKNIKGIFEPFAQYVQDQLNLRKKIVSNDLKSYKRYQENPELFFAYTQEKQCSVRMMSGVDLRDQNVGAQFLEIEKNRPQGVSAAWDETYLRWKTSGLARQYILEGGTRYYDDKTHHGWRGGFTTGERSDDEILAFAYGDRNVRANAQDNDFGIVPMPGITDATIQTKSNEGALREAQVNYICFNRRQLEILELLYMRPGYTVCLEWGWNPYISNNEEREPFDYTVKNAFFKEGNTLDQINRKIRNNKKKSGGNYDGFVGYIKNFTFKAREDGGYDCTTEIMAHGELLESLKSPVKKYYKVQADVEKPVVEYEDRLLFYFRALNHQLNSAGSQLYLSQFIPEYNAKGDTDIEFLMYNPDVKAVLQGQVPDVPEEYKGESLNDKKRRINELEKTKRAEFALQESALTKTTGLTEDEIINIANFRSIDPYKEISVQEAINKKNEVNENINNALSSGELNQDNIQVLSSNFSEMDDDQKQKFINFLSDKFASGEAVNDPNIPDLTIPDFNPSEGMTDDVAGGLALSLQSYYQKHPSLVDDPVEKNAELGKNAIKEHNERAKAWNEYLKIKAQELDLNIPVAYRAGLNDISRLYNFINKNKKDDVVSGFDPASDKGFQSLLGGAILKQTIQYNQYRETFERTSKGFISQGRQFWPKTVESTYDQTSVYDSGLRRNIYIRWDMLCQMLNHLGNASADEVATRLDLKFNYSNDNKKDTSQPKIKVPKDGLVEPKLEFTYMNPNQRTWNNRNPEKGKSPLNDSNEDGIMENNTLNGGYYLQYSPCLNYLADPMLKAEKDGTVKAPLAMKDEYHPFIGNSFDESICLLPHQSCFDKYFGRSTKTISSYASSNNAKDMRNGIGFVYFNLQYLTDTYESLRLKKESESGPSGTVNTYTTLNENFALYDFVRSIWDGVNSASAGYYNFQVHTEHERPNVVRIVDMRLNNPGENIFEFEPQGLKSITRNFYFDSTIDSDMASAISIAAQAPNSEQSLKSLSFKAFHKYIKDRFVRKDFIDEFPSVNKKLLKREELARDIMEFGEAYNNMLFYMTKLNSHDKSGDLLILQPFDAIKQAKKFIELRESILHRYPLFRKDGKTEHPKAGMFRSNTTTDSGAIIPLQCSLQMDGIAGLIPLQLFKIKKDKLPLGYRRDDIVFVIKSESQKITDGQDWTTEVTGQLALLNDFNPNNEGTNNILEYISPKSLVDLAIAENDTKWADYLRDKIEEFGHSENDYTGDQNMTKMYQEEFTSGELSSNGDISPEMAAFGEILIECMYDEDYANEIIYGSNRENWKYDNGGELSDVKIRFTAGNDKTHQIPDKYCVDGKLIWDKSKSCPNYSNSQHRTGNALDFVITSHGGGSENDIGSIDSVESYMNLINPNLHYYIETDGDTGELVLGTSTAGKVNVHGGLSSEALAAEGEKWKKYEIDQFGPLGASYNFPSGIQNGKSRTLYGFPLVTKLNAVMKLLHHLSVKFPNLYFKDEYRRAGHGATGAHFHVQARKGTTLVNLSQAALLRNEIELL